MYSFSGNCAASVPISTFCVCERFLYSQDRSTYTMSCSRTDRSIVGTFNSLTDTWMWKLCPHNSFSGNMCFEFSVLILCSAAQNRSLYAAFKVYCQILYAVHRNKALPTQQIWTLTFSMLCDGYIEVNVYERVMPRLPGEASCPPNSIVHNKGTNQQD